MAVTIGIDPHKGSHTAVALDEHEATLGQLRVRSGPEQLARLSEWAKAWPVRTWAVENASGLGYLLAQQLVAARRACRRRAAQAGGPGQTARTTVTSTRTTPMTPALSPLLPCGQNALSKWPKRTTPRSCGCGRAVARTSRAPAPGWPTVSTPSSWSSSPAATPAKIHASQGRPAARGASSPLVLSPPPARSWPNELLADLRRLDSQIKELRERLAAVVAASGTTTTKIFGVGPVVAAIAVGLTGDVSRFPDKDHFAAYNGTAPIEVSSAEEALPAVQEGQPPAEPRHTPGGSNPGPPRP